MTNSTLVASSNRGTKIRCIETGKVFNSIKECARELGVNHSDIEEWLTGKRKITIKGFTFEALSAKESLEYLKPLVIIMETEEAFPSVTECAAFIGCDRTTLSRHINGKTKQCSGYHVCYFENYDKDNNPYFGKTVEQKELVGKSKKIKCNETGQIFESISECGKVLKIASSSISSVLGGKRKSAGGFSFSYIV